MIAFTANMSTPPYPETFYADLNTKLNLTKNSSYVVITLIADMIIVYIVILVLLFLTNTITKLAYPYIHHLGTELLDYCHTDSYFHHRHW